MKCRSCESADVAVLATTTSDDRISRRRECRACGARWTTHELHESDTTAMRRAMDLVRRMTETFKELQNGTA